MSASLEGMSDDEVRALAQLAKQLGDSPKTRLGMMRLTKELDPSVSIPELDTLTTLGQVTKKIDERFNAFEAKQTERETTDRILAARRTAIAAGLISEAEVDALETFMIENGMTDHEKAAVHFKNAQRAAVPVTQPTARYEMPQDHLKLYKEHGRQGLSELIKNNAVQDIRDLRSGKIRIN